MSVDEMMDEYDRMVKHGFDVVAGGWRIRIIAALKAGRAMRGEVQEMAEGGYYLSTPLELALEIWDDTTKEDV